MRLVNELEVYCQGPTYLGQPGRASSLLMGSAVARAGGWRSAGLDSGARRSRTPADSRLVNPMQLAYEVEACRHSPSRLAQLPGTRLCRPWGEAVARARDGGTSGKVGEPIGLEWQTISHGRQTRGNVA